MFFLNATGCGDPETAEEAEYVEFTRRLIIGISEDVIRYDRRFSVAGDDDGRPLAAPPAEEAGPSILSNLGAKKTRYLSKTEVNTCIAEVRHPWALCKYGDKKCKSILEFR